jgi:hypothetical protein
MGVLRVLMSLGGVLTGLAGMLVGGLVILAVQLGSLTMRFGRVVVLFGGLGMIGLRHGFSNTVLYLSAHSTSTLQSGFGSKNICNYKK